MKAGLLLPIHETFYGEIQQEDLSKFLACAEEALRTFGFSRIQTLNANTDAEQELWGIGELTIEGMPPSVVTLEGNDAELAIDWLRLIDSDTDEILEVLKSTQLP